MTTRYERLRFHADTGPAALFEWVRFKIHGRRMLHVHADHLHCSPRSRSCVTSTPPSGS